MILSFSSRRMLQVLQSGSPTTVVLPVTGGRSSAHRFVIQRAISRFFKRLHDGDVTISHGDVTDVLVLGTWIRDLSDKANRIVQIAVCPAMAHSNVPNQARRKPPICPA
jgi:hypothetical protein